MVLVLGWVGICAEFSKGLFFHLLDAKFKLSRKAQPSPLSAREGLVPTAARLAATRVSDRLQQGSIFTNSFPTDGEMLHPALETVPRLSFNRKQSSPPNIFSS